MRDALDILAPEYRPMVLACLRAMVRNAHLAEDLVQKTMIAAHESLGGFEPGGKFGRWLRGIARNKAPMDLLRRPLQHFPLTKSGGAE